MKLNWEEEVVKQHLLTQGIAENDIKPEPHPNSTPDLLIDGHTAIEVRRLNQNYLSTQEPEGLEQDQIRLHNTLKGVLRKESDALFEESWFVGFTLQRPLPEKRKDLAKELEFHLRKHKTSMLESYSFVITGGTEIKIWRSTAKLDQQHKIGFQVDGDAACQLVSNLYENLVLAVNEKTEIVNKVRDRYDVWWLALVDYIGFFDMNAQDYDQFRKLPPVRGCFDRIFIVSEQNPEVCRNVFEDDLS